LTVAISSKHNAGIENRRFASLSAIQWLEERVEHVSDTSSSFDRTFCLRAVVIVHAGSGGHNRGWSTAAGSGGHNKIESEVVIFNLGAFYTIPLVDFTTFLITD
jgi:hypothetical protein